MPKLTTAIFEKDGRTFTLPGLQYLSESAEPETDAARNARWREQPGNPIQISFQAMNLATMLQAKLSWRKYETTDDDPWTINLPCAEGTIRSRHFEHGGCKVWIFSGPKTDANLESQVYA